MPARLVDDLRIHLAPATSRKRCHLGTGSEIGNPGSTQCQHAGFTQGTSGQPSVAGGSPTRVRSLRYAVLGACLILAVGQLGSQVVVGEQLGNLVTVLR